MKISPITRFKRYYRIDHLGDCWLWQRSLNNSGYGSFFFNGILTTAHRASWMLFKGEIPEECFVLHVCDIRHCVNPDHLFLGTQSDNVQDMLKKGRAKYIAHHGENNGRARLSAQQVEEIRALASRYLHREIAKQYHVARQTISDIVAYRKWNRMAEQPDKYQVRREDVHDL